MRNQNKIEAIRRRARDLAGVVAASRREGVPPATIFADLYVEDVEALLAEVDAESDETGAPAPVRRKAT